MRVHHPSLGQTRLCRLPSPGVCLPTPACIHCCQSHLPKLGSASASTASTPARAPLCLFLWLWQPSCLAAPSLATPAYPDLGVSLGVNLTGLTATCNSSTTTASVHRMPLPTTRASTTLQTQDELSPSLVLLKPFLQPGLLQAQGGWCPSCTESFTGLRRWVLLMDGMVYSRSLKGHRAQAARSAPDPSWLQASRPSLSWPWPGSLPPTLQVVWHKREFVWVSLVCKPSSSQSPPP